MCVFVYLSIYIYIYIYIYIHTYTYCQLFGRQGEIIELKMEFLRRKLGMEPKRRPIMIKIMNIMIIII